MLVDITGTITKVTPKPVSYKAGELKPTMDIRRCTVSIFRATDVSRFRFPSLIRCVLGYGSECCIILSNVLEFDQSIGLFLLILAIFH